MTPMDADEELTLQVFGLGFDRRSSVFIGGYMVLCLPGRSNPCITC
jgi:hypothetical protein